MKKHILFVSYHYWPPHFGGELLISIERFQGLLARGFTVTVLTSGAQGFADHEMLQGISIHRSPSIGEQRFQRLLRRVVYVFWAAWFLFYHSFDIYYQGDTAGIDAATSALSVGMLTLIAHAKHALTVIVHSLAVTEQKSLDLTGWDGFWRKMTLCCFDRIVAVSPGLYRDLERIFPQTARLIVNGIRDDLFAPLPAPTRQRIREQQAATSEQVIFAFLGTVGYRKGFDLLAQAFAALAPQYPHWRLWVIGPYTKQHSQNLDPQEVAQVTAPLANVQSQVKFWGRVDDRPQLNQLLAATDVFVFASRREGMGLAPVEAMSAGVPVIIAQIPGVTDLANLHGETGLYIPVGDVAALQAAMEQLGTDSALRVQMGQKAAQRAHDAFGWQAHLTEWQDLLLDPPKT